MTDHPDPEQRAEWRKDAENDCLHAGTPDDAVRILAPLDALEDALEGRDVAESDLRVYEVGRAFDKVAVKERDFYKARATNAERELDTLKRSESFDVAAEQLIPRYAMLDVWCALYGPETANLFESFCDEHGYAETWSRLMSEVRGEKARAVKAEQERNDAERRARDLTEDSLRLQNRVIVAGSHRKHYADDARKTRERWMQDKGALAAAEAREAVLRDGIRTFVSDWQANGNSRPLGDCTADIWQKCARHLLDLLSGMEAPKPDCDTCNDEGRIRYMSEGDPNGYVVADDEGMTPCPDCAPKPDDEKRAWA